MKQRLQEGKITADEYNDELSNLKDRLKEIINNINVMRDNYQDNRRKDDEAMLSLKKIIDVSLFY